MEVTKMASNKHNESVTLWDVLTKMRGKMSPIEYQKYILPFLFYDFASFSVGRLMKEELKNEEPVVLVGGATRPITYAEAWEKKDEDGNFEYKDYLKERQLENFGFVIEPQYMSERVIEACCQTSSTQYFRDFFEDAIDTFEHHCADNFKGTLRMIDLYNEALGETDEKADDVLTTLFAQTAYMCNNAWNREITTNKDILGDIFEELMEYFAGSAGKKGGEFYTPAEMSELVAKLATFEVEKARAISDPTCGSGSLLIKVAEHLQNKGGIVGDLYGQELNSLTHRLAKMNMCLHNVKIDDFHIDCVDTLSVNDNVNSKKFNDGKQVKFDITVANPPYAVEWDNGEYRLADSRFSGYGALAPRSNADLAFVQHIIHHMSDNGHAAILLPLGVLFRGNAEQTIRQAMIDTYNIIDAIVVLPSNCFYGASIPVCCMVLRKDRGTKNNICFIDASNEFIKDGKKNKLTSEGIEKIYNAFAKRENIEHFCSIVEREDIKANGYNLNISLYVEAEKIVEEHDIDALAKEYASLEAKAEYLKKSLNEQFPLFGISELFNVNEDLANQHQPADTKTENDEEDTLDF